MNFENKEYDAKFKELISSAFDSGRLPHAIILEGANASKRLEAASLLAKALVCKESEKSLRPCGKCPDCIKAESDSHVDIKTVIGTNKSKTVSVEDIRNVRSDAYVVPNEAERKVYIITSAHKMNETAMNAFLKVLEEPPSYVNFILECEDKAMLLQTVKSRCASFRLGDLTDDSVTKKKLEASFENAVKIAKAISSDSEIEMMKTLGMFEKDKDALKLALEEVILILRDSIALKSGAVNCLSQNEDVAKEIASSMTSEKIIKATEIVNDTLQSMQYYANHNLLLARLSSRLKD
ncbi:MAG: hypothetical protein IJ279_07360 [Clostridia bacterium]|nr:hypothetical protein [Clostridia bacterium]